MKFTRLAVVLVTAGCKQATPQHRAADPWVADAVAPTPELATHGGQGDGGQRHDPVAVDYEIAARIRHDLPMLPEVRLSRLESTTAPMVRIVIDSGGISLDDALAFLPPESSPAPHDEQGTRASIYFDHLINLGSSGYVIGNDIRGGSAGLLVNPLNDALYGLPTNQAEGRAIIVAVEFVPYRTFFEVLYTLGQHGFRDFFLRARQGNREVELEIESERDLVSARRAQQDLQAAQSALDAIDWSKFNALTNSLNPARLSLAERPPRLSLAALAEHPPHAGLQSEHDLSVRVLNNGYALTLPSGAVQPGCATVGSAVVTLPLVYGELDAIGLNRCVQAMRRPSSPWHARLRAQRHARVFLEENIPYRSLIVTLDALRESELGARDMFTEPLLGMIRSSEFGRPPEDGARIAR